MTDAATTYCREASRLIGARMRERRTALGLHCRTAARLCGLRWPELLNAEQGMSFPASLAPAVADGLGLSLDELLRGPSTPDAA